MDDTAHDGALDEPQAVRAENRFDAARLRPFLKARLPDLPDAEVRVRQFSGGASNLTYQLDIGNRSLVLRRPPAGTKPKSGHDMHREYRVLVALHGHFPCPQVYAYSDDVDLIGAPFYVMEKLDGTILRRDPPAHLHYDATQARQLCHNLLDTLIRLHTLDYASLGLTDLGHPTGYVQRQVDGWCARFERAWTSDMPKFKAVMAWVRAHCPPDSPRPGLIHNDYRFDNVVLSPKDDLTIVGVLDWEMCTLGDPLMDLGSVLAYWIQADDPPELEALRMQPSNLPGMLDRRGVLDYYAERTGCDTTHFGFYYIFGLFRLAAIAQQIYYRFKLGQTHNPKFQRFSLYVETLAKVTERAIAEQG